jgi:pimeloyl-ACP methyl ester carboxylesterase
LRFALPFTEMVALTGQTGGVHLTRRRAAAVVIAAGLGLSACTGGSKPAPVSSAPTPVAPTTSAPVSSLPAPSASAVQQPVSSSASSPTPATSAAVPPAPSALPHIDEATLQTFYSQQLAWQDCGSGFQCASLRVPIDYAHPTAGTIKLTVTRYRTSSKSRLGSVVLNPGGPGASGIEYAHEASSIISGVLGHRFDVVSFDPRGVGASAPVKCLSDKDLDAWVAFEADPNSASSVVEQDRLAKNFAAGCVARTGATLLAHVSTLDTARDLDVLRAAIGDTKLTYIGASYGTFLGAIYAQLFPTHIRALVLDGALDPAASAGELDSVQAQGFEVALASYIASCVTSSNCALGTSMSAAEPKLDTWLVGLRSAPVPGSGGRTLTAALAVGGVAAALYTPTRWSALTSALSSAMGGHPDALLTLSDKIDGRNSDGTYDNLIESNAAINCVDRAGLGPNIQAYAQAAAAGAKDGATFGEYIDWGNVACADWPVAPEMSAGPVTAVGAPPILVIGTLRDPATPYRWAQALAKELGGPLLTYNGDGHTAFLRSVCVNTVVKSYLVSLQMPAAGSVCK